MAPGTTSAPFAGRVASPHRGEATHCVDRAGPLAFSSSPSLVAGDDGMGHVGPILVCEFHQVDPWTGIGRRDDKLKAGSPHDATSPDLGRQQSVGTAAAE